MDETPEPQADKKTNAFVTLADLLYLHKLPSYGNSIFYGLGFLALTSLMMLVVTGFLLAFMGQVWWLNGHLGIYARSVHLWSVQALIAVLLLHILVVFTTSGFKAPRRMIWVFGATIFCLLLIDTEFGYGLRGDFSSQFRAVSGADFWNGAYLGYLMNPLSFIQEYALHITIIPIVIFMLFLFHYLLIKRYGVAKPYREDVPYTMADANHYIMWARGAVLIVAILLLAYLFPSPYVEPITIASVAKQDPQKVAKALFDEFDHTSDTATYLDSIDPYTFDTREIFVVEPYEKVVSVSGSPDAWLTFQSAPADIQQQYLDEARKLYPDDSGDATTTEFNEAPDTAGTTTQSAVTATTTPASAQNPVLTMINTLMPATQNGLYESILDQEHPSINYTYSLRFLSDMDVFEDKAQTLNMSTEEWGMAKDETGSLGKMPPGSWWFAPIGMLNSTFDLTDNDNGDRIAAESLGIIMLLFIAFPYIPYFNRISELFIPIARFIWRRGR